MIDASLLINTLASNMFLTETQVFQNDFWQNFSAIMQDVSVAEIID